MAYSDKEMIEKFSKMEHKIESLEEDSGKMSIILQTVHELSADIRLLTEQLKRICERVEQIAITSERKIEEIDEKVHLIQMKPAKMWEKMSMQFAILVMAAVIAYAAGKFM